MSQGIARADLEPGLLIPSKLGNELHRYSKIANVGDIAADSDAIKIPIFKPPAAITVKRVLMGVDTAIVKADTNYQKLYLTDGTNTIATIQTGPNSSAGTSFTAGVFVELTVVAMYALITAAEQLYLSFIKEGSGMVMSNLCIQIDYEINDPS